MKQQVHDAHLQIAALRNEPVVDELLRVFREAEEEISADLQLVDALHRLVDLTATTHHVTEHRHTHPCMHAVTSHTCVYVRIFIGAI